MRNTTWLDYEINFIKENYKTMTNQQMANYLDRSKTAVDLKINRLELKKSKYTYNHSYFKNIDTEIKAYWLGFIFALLATVNASVNKASPASIAVASSNSI